MKVGNRSLKQKIQYVTYGIFSVGLIEHSFYRSSQVNLFEEEIKYCNYTLNEHLLYYISKDYDHYVKVLPLNKFIGILLYVSFQLSTV